MYLHDFATGRPDHLKKSIVKSSNLIAYTKFIRTYLVIWIPWSGYLKDIPTPKNVKVSDILLFFSWSSFRL